MSFNGVRRKHEKIIITFLSVKLIGLVVTAMLDTTTTYAFAQTTSSPVTDKKDIFKVIMTVQGLDHNTGDIVTIVSVNGESRVKLFDDGKTYIQSINAAGTGGIVEYVATFPNMTVKNGDVYKVCVLTIKDSNLVCETGTNSPALRPEFKDLYLQEQEPATSSQAAKISDDEG
ncbi:MAG TPA: hypothetical protein VFY68_04590 [Nitrososphaeraceae archaeon]|nr:hypothetical protein [Nitrososphaeraceae archaeon]